MASPVTPGKRTSKPLSSNTRRKTHKAPVNLPLEPPRDFFPTTRVEFVRLLAVVVVATSVAVFCNFVVTHLNQQPKPFCDSFADFVSDDCEPCPSNGVCQEGRLECVSGYREHGKLCLEDGEVNEAARKLSKLVEVHLCEAYAQHLCGGTGSIWASKSDVWNLLDEYKKIEKHGLDGSSYNLAKLKAVDAIGRTMEIRVDNLKSEEFKCPELLAQQYKPLTCRVQQWILEHARVLVPVCALVFRNERSL